MTIWRIKGRIHDDYLFTLHTFIDGIGWFPTKVTLIPINVFWGNK